MGWRTFKVLIFIGVLFFITQESHAQVSTTTFIDPCTKEVTYFTVPLQGGTTIFFLNQSRYFTAADVTSGAFSAWVNQVYTAYRQTNPCSQQQGQVTQNQITSQIISNTVQSVVGSIMASAQSSATSSGGNLNASQGNNNKKNGNNNSNSNTNGSNNNNGGGSNSSDGNSNGNQSSNSGGTTTSSGGNNSSQGNSTSSQGGNNGNTNNPPQGGSGTSQPPVGGSSSSGGGNTGGSGTTGGGSTGNNGGSSSSGGSSTGNNGGGSTGSSGSNTGGGSTGNSGGSGGGGGSTGNSSGSGTTGGSSTTGGGSTGGSGTTGTGNQNNTQQKSEEVGATTTMNNDAHNDNGSSDNNSSGGNGGGKSGGGKSGGKGGNGNPMIISSDLTTAQNLDKTFTPILNLSMNRSSMTGLSSIGATTMIWANLKQFALSAKWTKLNYNKKQTLKYIHNVNLTGVYTYGNILAFVGYSGILNAGKYGVTGFNISGAVSIIAEDKSGFYSPSITAFYTKPLRVTKKFTMSPEIYIMSTPLVYSTKEQVTITDRYFSGFLGSGFDYQITKRFKVNMNYKANLSTNPEIPILSFFLIGSKINL